MSLILFWCWPRKAGDNETKLEAHERIRTQFSEIRDRGQWSLCVPRLRLWWQADTQLIGCVDRDRENGLSQIYQNASLDGRHDRQTLYLRENAMHTRLALTLVLFWWVREKRTGYRLGARGRRINSRGGLTFNRCIWRRLKSEKNCYINNMLRCTRKQNFIWCVNKKVPLVKI